MKTTITRQELKQIYDLSCKDWKSKLENYAKADPFSETLTFTEKQIQEGISACNSKQLLVINKIFDIQDITSRINDFKDVLDYLGEEDKEVILYRKMLNFDIGGKPLHIQMAICWNRALNEKHEFTEDDKKWRIWWNIYPFSFDCSGYGSAHAFVPLALCFKNEKLSNFAGNNKEYQELCKQFIS